MNQEFLDFMQAQISVEEKLIQHGIEKSLAVELTPKLSQIFIDKNVIKEDIVEAINEFVEW